MNLRSHGVVAFVCSTDTLPELELVQKLALGVGAFDAVICNHWALGGAGAAGLAVAVEKASQAPSNFKFLYELDVSVLSSWCLQSFLSP